jgi:CBS-domain-containing membrane protein
MSKKRPQIVRLLLSRGGWPLARYLATRSPAPMPPVARAGDDVLHVAKLAVASAIPRTVYVVDDEGRYLGAVTESRLAQEVFAHLDPGLYVDQHAHATTKLLHLGKDVAKSPASALIETKHQPLGSRRTIADAMSALYRAGIDELPVINEDKQLLGVIRSLDILREWVEDLLLAQGDETGSFY